MLYSKEAVADFNQHRFDFLLVEEKDHVLYLTLNRPDKKNAMNQVFMNELAFCLAYAHYTPSVWVVVVGANGDVFSAGADLKAFAGMPQPAVNSTIPEPDRPVALGEEFNQLHKPCIAKVQGPVMAGGHLIVCGCTHVIGCEKSTFSLPEVKRGIWPMQVMASLAPILPARRLLDYCMRGDTISPERALDWGLLTRLTEFEDLDDEVQQLVEDIKSNSPSAIRLGLKAWSEMKSIPPADMHFFLLERLGEILGTADAAEGLTAFREKRKPEWTGL